MTEPDRRDVERRQIRDLVVAKAERTDRFRTVVEASLGSIPTGSGLAGLFNIDRLKMLADRLADPEVAALGVTAISMAGRTSSDEKLRHIATAVAQIVEGCSPWVDDADFTQMLMHLVDDLTATQIAYLQFLAYPARWEKRSGICLDALPLDEEGRLRTETVVTAAFPGYTTRSAALQAVLGGLEARGLMAVMGLTDEEGGYRDAADFRKGSASSLGIALLRFLELDNGPDQTTG